ncbi:ribonuclease H-like domain-containing protein [Tanacetum coccineum]
MGCPLTANEKTQKKNDVKARSMLLMALPNEHLLTFNPYKDAKTLFAAIQARFGGNDAIKKTQKTLLKQMYENFSALSTESLDYVFNRLQKIVSQLAILGENISQKDLNLKFLRKETIKLWLKEWNTHVVVWRNKPDLDTMSFDDLYNNFKIIEQEVKGTASSSSSSSSQNLDFVSSTSSTNEVNTAYGVTTANTQVSTTSTQKTGRKITINGSDTDGYDKSKVECFNYHKLGHFTRECRGPRNQNNRSRNQDSSRRTINVEEIFSKAMLAIDGAGFDWSFIGDEEVPTDMALIDFSDSEVHNDKNCSKTCLKSFKTLKTQLDDLRIEFKNFEFNLATYKRGLASVEEQLVFYKKNAVLFCKQLAILKRDKDSEISVLKSELEKLKQEKESNQLKIGKFNNASKSLDKLIGSQIPDKNRRGLGFFEGYGPKTSKSVSEDTSNEVRESLDASLVEELVSNDKLEKKTANYNYHQRERMVSGNNYTRANYNYFAKKAHPSAHRNIVPRAILMKTGLRPLNTARPVNTAHPKTIVYSARPMPKAVNTTRPNLAVVNDVRENQGHPQKEDQGYVDSGCSRHMIGNMSYLSDFKEFDRGYVAFGGGAKGGRITSKRTLKIGKLDFEDVYFVKELQFNLLSVSQMCDKKNSVLFTDTGCFVLSPKFKLVDESQVLLKVPKKSNMYSVNMKNIILKESLTCLVAKAILDESILCHRRLGHVNFKTINKLVKDNLVKVVTDDYSRFTWVFFLASKDETSGILKSFITQIENLVDKKVRIIRRNNGTEFKNRVMSEFCEEKSIKREFNVARTPQQNGVAERRNRTLIKAARTMLADFKLPTTFWAKAVNTACKFDGKSNDGFFVGYSLNSKAFIVYNIRTMKVEENLHVRFLEDKSIIAGDGPKWLFDIDVLTKSMNYVLVVAGTNSNDFVDGSLFDSSSKDASNDEPQPSNDAEKKDDKGGIDDQEMTKNIPTTLLKSTYPDFFGDESELDLSNIATTYPVPFTLNTRIHKDHSLDHVIGNMQSGVQRRRMINK